MLFSHRRTKNNVSEFTKAKKSRDVAAPEYPVAIKVARCDDHIVEAGVGLSEPPMCCPRSNWTQLFAKSNQKTGYRPRCAQRSFAIEFGRQSPVGKSRNSHGNLNRLDK
jgi:hypothetical protein